MKHDSSILFSYVLGEGWWYADGKRFCVQINVDFHECFKARPLPAHLHEEFIYFLLKYSIKQSRKVTEINIEVYAGTHSQF